jgi:hypothetical protein
LPDRQQPQHWTAFSPCSAASIWQQSSKVGLNLGPTFADTGSLSALLWYRGAQRVAARPSLWRVSEIGIVLVPCSIAAALVALRLITCN